MKIATLAIILRGQEGNEEILLGYKKTGEIGQGTLNGPGGKCEAGEELLECLDRELQEEIGISIVKDATHKVAVLTCYFAEEPGFEVHVYIVRAFLGEPIETADMVPGWYRTRELPLLMTRMMESDREWFEKAVRGEMFTANIYYRGKGLGFDRIEFLQSHPK